MLSKLELMATETTSNINETTVASAICNENLKILSPFNGMFIMVMVE
jgi:hypothetical protein